MNVIAPFPFSSSTSTTQILSSQPKRHSFYNSLLPFLHPQTSKRLLLYKADIAPYVRITVRTPRTHLIRHHTCPFVTYFSILCSLHPSSNRPLESTTTPLDVGPSTPANLAASTQPLSLEDPAFVTVPPQPHALNASGELNGHTLFEQDLDLDQGITVDPFIPQSDYALRVHA
jgi:hypothetical protein